MSKRNISYIKPDEPSFLKKIKEQIGYKEGPTVDTKKQLCAYEEDDDSIDEQPTVVVLKPGDLSAEEAAKEKARIEKDTEEAPADLSSKIVFKVPSKSSDDNKSKKRDSTSEKECKSKQKRQKKNLLSFDAEEDDEY